MKELQRKMIRRRHRENNKAKIAAYKRKKYAENKEYRENILAKKRNKYAENQHEAFLARMVRAAMKKEMYREKAKMARIVSEEEEEELLEQMLTAQANLLMFVADVVVCRAQCERLQQPRA